MRAMVLRRQREPLVLEDVPRPEPKSGQLLIRVEACAVCRTDLHVVDAELSEPKLPLILGHQIVGRDQASGKRVGVPWLGWTDGTCRYCTTGRENLCERALFTGYTLDGGYAEWCVADARYCFGISEIYSAEEAAPLLCAGLIGFRAYRMVCGPALAGQDDRVGPVHTLGFYGFGSSAQILAQVASAEGRKVFAFTREGDAAAQAFAREMGAVWAGGSSEAPPEPLDAAIIFAPVGPLVVTALRNVVKGGVVVCAGIHMSDIPSFSYDLLWGERVIRSVANLTRQDGAEFFERARGMRIVTRRTTYPLEQANEALTALRNGELVGTAVLRTED
ncbi:MAG TPA: zinc-dependent alcohol dehydrogenase family protein [Thermoanaerobaculia bacterium]|nr:zinc-dependent alcohol dehydrogenase family protein [Thermoanaerobaculia bacterium]